MEVTCPYSQHVKRGFTEYKTCSINQDICGFIRRCSTKNTVIHTSGALTCKLRKQMKGE